MRFRAIWALLSGLVCYAAYEKKNLYGFINTL
jgi:hypothetical protein